MQDYETLLERACKKIPKSVLTKERFEIPKVKGHIEGNKTIISNFNQICDIVRREPNQILKYLQRELASPGSINGPRLILGRKIPSELVNSKIQRYVTEFVICEECKKPDTKLERENKILIKKCMACGARHPVKAKI